MSSEAGVEPTYPLYRRGIELLEDGERRRYSRTHLRLLIG